MYTFEEKLSIFDEYISKYGRYPNSKEEYNDFNLGIWINNLRMIYNHGIKDENNDIVYNSYRLTNKQVKLLKEHNFYFSDFDMYLGAFKEFVDTYNKYPLFNETYKNLNIGSWVIKNRVVYNNGKLNENGDIYYKTYKLTNNQIKKLNDVSFIWKPIKKPLVWDKNFDLLKEFVQINKRFPKNNEVFKNKCLGAWLSNQKTNFNKGVEIKKDVYKYKHNSVSSKEQILKLNDLGVEFVSLKNKYYNEEIKTKEELLYKRRYLLLQLYNLYKEENITINSKKDIEKINELYLKRLSN